MANTIFCNQLKALVAKYLVSKQDYGVKIYFDPHDHALCITLTYTDNDRNGYIIFIPDKHAYTGNSQLIHDISTKQKPRNVYFDFTYCNRVSWDFDRNLFYISNGASSHDLPRFLNTVIHNIAILANAYIDMIRYGISSDEENLKSLQSHLVNGKFVR